MQLDLEKAEENLSSKSLQHEQLVRKVTVENGKKLPHTRDTSRSLIYMLGCKMHFF